MKRFLAILVAMMMLAFGVFAAPTLVISQKPTLSWDPVTKDVTGAALPAGGVITYDVLWQPVGGGTAVTLNTGLTATSIQLTSLGLWLFYDLGVRANMTYQGSVISSSIAWGSVAGTPSPFTLLTGAAISVPGNIRITP